MKKLMNSPEQIIADELRGIEYAHPELRVDHEARVVFRAGGPVQNKVGLVSGGGSGHEPLHGGYVGEGMLDAAVAGEVFTSPTPDQIEAATTGVNAGAGVLHIVKNYTGDILNFEMAAELAAADGVEVESVVVDDDVAVQDSLYTAGRRGVGGTVFVEKIAGASLPRRAWIWRVLRSWRAARTRMFARWAWRSRRARYRPQAHRRLIWPTTKWRLALVSTASRGVSA